jgi:hypothetical protein
MREAAFLRRLYWWSFTLRFSAGLAGWFITHYADLPLMQDALYYEEVAGAVADDWLAGRSSQWLESAVQRDGQPWLMVTLLAVFYFLASGARITPVVMGLYSLITAWAPVVIYHVGRRLGAPPSGARTAGWLVALSPAFAFWSGALYKEGLILVVFSLALYHTLLLQSAWRPVSLFILSLCIPALLGLRFYLALIMSVVLGCGLLLGRQTGRTGCAGPELLLRQALLVGCLALALVAVGFTVRAQATLPADLSEGLDRLQRSRDDLANQPSGYLRGARVGTPAEAVEFLPVGLGYFLTVPWPWQLGSVRQNLVIPETAFWILLYPLMLIGVREGLKRNFQGTLLLLAATLAVCCLYALFVSNVGTAYRLRIQVWAIWAVFVGWGWASLRRPGNQPLSKNVL